MNQAAVQIILAVHGNLGQALKESCYYFTGDSEPVKVCSLNEGEEIHEWERKLLSWVDSCPQTLILTDMLKASTTVHASQALRGRPDVELVTGVNLAMMVKAVQMASVWDVHRLARSIQETGKEDILYLRDKLGDAVEPE